jgi:hypothetical protein
MKISGHLGEVAKPCAGGEADPQVPVQLRP